MKQIPNILSSFRLVLVAVFFYLFTKQNYEWSMVVYLVASSTDILDGYLARKNNWITNVGKVLDPLADKLMLFVVLYCFYSIGKIPLPILLVVFVKDLVMIVIGIVLYSKKVVVYADWFGKIATGLFMLAIILTFVNIIWQVETYYIWFYLLALAVAIVSFFHYGIKTLIKKQGNGRMDD
ncbi:MAG: CDP-alcohol phosphatidyltransferase family protein [Clostridia bacterium]|nr:CDP-alcohol phosphatidyltransferase family protein [Clostridia bacterium]